MARIADKGRSCYFPLLILKRGGASAPGWFHSAPAKAGVFAVLRDEELFRQVRLEWGAVTWPGELDLVTDAMYGEIKQHRELQVLLPVLPWRLDQAGHCFFYTK